MHYHVVLSSRCAAWSALNAVGLNHVPVLSISILSEFTRLIKSVLFQHAHTQTHTHVGRSGKAAARANECTPTLYGAVCTESMHSVGARDRPHPRRSNNKNYHNKEQRQNKRLISFFFFFLKKKVFAFGGNERTIWETTGWLKKSFEKGFSKCHSSSLTHQILWPSGQPPHKIPLNIFTVDPNRRLLLPYTLLVFLLKVWRILNWYTLIGDAFSPASTCFLSIPLEHRHIHGLADLTVLIQTIRNTYNTFSKMNNVTTLKWNFIIIKEEFSR